MVSYQLARCLAGRHQVQIYARRGEKQSPRERDDLGIEIRRISGLSKRLNSVLEITTGLMNTETPWFASKHYYAGFAEKICDELRNEQIDVIHVGACTQLITPLREAAPKAGIVLHVHDEAITRLNPRLIAARLEGADRILAVNEYLSCRLRERFPELAGRFRTLHNGVDVEHFRPPLTMNRQCQSQRRLLYVGRLSPEKGLHVLVEAFARVLEIYPDCSLDLVGPAGFMPFAFIQALSSDPVVASVLPYYGGSPPQRFARQVLRADSSYVQALRSAVSNKVSQRITFHPAVQHPELLHFYQKADLVVAPSVCNEQPLSLAEAMACGLPAVCTYQSSIDEFVVHQHTGLVVKRGNVTSLTQAILALLGDSERSREMGDAGRRRVERYFTWQRATEKLLDFYRELKVETTSGVSGTRVSPAVAGLPSSRETAAESLPGK